MYWFKHFTNARNDPILKELFQKFGSDGIVTWWNTLEFIGEQVNPKNPWPLIDTEPAVFASEVGVSSTTLDKVYTLLNRRRKIKFRKRRGKWLVFWPKLLEASDEYTKRYLSKHPDIDTILSGHYRERVRKEQQAERREDKKEEKSEEPNPKRKGPGDIEPPDLALVDRPCLKISASLLAAAGVNGALAKVWCSENTVRRVFNVCRRAKKMDSPGGFIRRAFEQNLDVPDRLTKKIAAEYAQEIAQINQDHKAMFDKHSPKKATPLPRKEGESDNDYLRRIAEEAKKRILKT